jgi:hypothetical protein
MVISAHNDIGFPIPGQRDVVKYGQTLYGALGAAGKVGYFEDADEGHGYQKRKREAAYGWFLKWLKGEGDGSPAAEPELNIPAWNLPELRCFPAGKNVPAGPGMNALAQSILEKAPPRPATPDAMRRSIASVLGISDPLPVAAAPDLVSADEERLVIGDHINATRQPVRRVGWRTGDGIAIPANLIWLRSEPRGALIVVGDAAKEKMMDHPAVRQAIDAEWIVVLADLRGVGELHVTRPGWVYAMSLLLGENFVGRQALDLVSGFRALRAESFLRGKPVGILAVGAAASLAGLYASVLEPGVAWFAGEQGFHSFRAFVRRPPQSFALAEPGKERDLVLDREIPHALVPFGIAMGPDIPDLLSSLGPNRAVWASAVDENRFHAPGPASSLEFIRARLEESR